MPTASTPAPSFITRLRRAGLSLAPVIAAALSAAGCASSGTLTMNQRAAAVPVQNDEFAKLGYRVDWRGFPVVMNGGTIAQFNTLGDAVGALDSTGVFTLLDAKSGSIRWSDQPSGPLTEYHGSVRDGKTVLLASQTDTFVYDATTGTLQAKLSTPQVISTTPVVIGGLAIYGSHNGTIFGIMKSGGFQAWATGVQGAIEENPVRFGDTTLLAMVSRDGEVLVFDGSSGRGVGRAKIFEGPGAPLAHSDTLAFIPSTDHSLYAVTRDTAEVLWRFRTDAPLHHAPLFFNNKVLVDLGAQGVCAVDSGSGKKLWSNPDVHGDAVAIRKGKLLVFDGAKVALLDPANGVTIDTVNLKNVSMLHAETLIDGPLYAISSVGVITRLVPR